MFSAWKRIAVLYNFASEKKERDEALAILHGETRRVINLRRSQIGQIVENSRNIDSADESVLGAKHRRPFLDSLLITQRDTGLLTDANIQEEVDTFMFEVRPKINVHIDTER